MGTNGCFLVDFTIVAVYVSQTLGPRRAPREQAERRERVAARRPAEQEAAARGRAVRETEAADPVVQGRREPGQRGALVVADRPLDR